MSDQTEVKQVVGLGLGKNLGPIRNLKVPHKIESNLDLFEGKVTKEEKAGVEIELSQV